MCRELFSWELFDTCCHCAGQAFNRTHALATKGALPPSTGKGRVSLMGGWVGVTCRSKVFSCMMWNIKVKTQWDIGGRVYTFKFVCSLVPFWSQDDLTPHSVETPTLPTLISCLRVLYSFLSGKVTQQSDRACVESSLVESCLTLAVIVLDRHSTGHTRLQPKAHYHLQQEKAVFLWWEDGWGSHVDQKCFRSLLSEICFFGWTASWFTWPRLQRLAELPKTLPRQPPVAPQLVKMRWQVWQGCTSWS